MKNYTLKEVQAICNDKLRNGGSCVGCPFYHEEDRKVRRYTLHKWCEVFELPNNLWQFDEDKELLDKIQAKKEEYRKREERIELCKLLKEECIKKAENDPVKEKGRHNKCVNCLDCWTLADSLQQAGFRFDKSTNPSERAMQNTQGATNGH